jgi:hypothetical protein
VLLQQIEPGASEYIFRSAAKKERSALAARRFVAQLQGQQTPVLWKRYGLLPTAAPMKLRW